LGAIKLDASTIMRLRLQPPATRFYILIAFMGVCVFTGGSSRADADLLLVLRPLTTIFLAMLLIATPHSHLVSVKPLLTLLGLFALTMAIQLVPLPPTVWIALPGHARFAAVDTVLNAAPPWRPVSLTPDLTLNSLLALLPALVMVIGFAGIGRFRYKLILFPITIAAISVLLGIIQISSGSDSAAYLYRPTSDLLPVGLFANRNHQAVMLAIALPALAIWAREPGAGRYRLGVAGGFGLLLLPVILATGSRAGMAMAGFGTVAAGFLIFPKFKTFRTPKVFYIVASVLFLIVIAVTVVTGRAISLDRFAEMDGPSSQLRWTTLPIVLTIIKNFLPFGTGYGAFDEIFRVYEPDSLLRPTFFNRAHDDILETILSGPGCYGDVRNLVGTTGSSNYAIG
jgi:hypothetical protein